MSVTQWYARQDASGQGRYIDTEAEAERWAFSLPLKGEQVDIFKSVDAEDWEWVSSQIVLQFDGRK